MLFEKVIHLKWIKGGDFSRPEWLQSALRVINKGRELENFANSFRDKIGVKHIHSEVTFAIGSQFIRPAMHARLSANNRLARKHLANPITGRCEVTANEHTAEAPQTSKRVTNVVGKEEKGRGPAQSDPGYSGVNVGQGGAGGGRKESITSEARNKASCPCRNSHATLLACSSSPSSSSVLELAASCGTPGLLASIKGEPGSIPAGSLMWDSYRMTPLVGGFSRRSAVSPAAPESSIILIGSQHLAVKRRPTLFTHSLTRDCGRGLLGSSRVEDVFSNLSAIVAVATIREQYLTNRRRSGNSLESHSGGPGFDSRSGDPDFGFPKLLQANAGMGPKQRPSRIPSHSLPILPPCATCAVSNDLAYGATPELKGGGTPSHVQKSGVTRPGIEPGPPWWEASRLTAHPPRPSPILEMFFDRKCPGGASLAGRRHVVMVTVGGGGRGGLREVSQAAAQRAAGVCPAAVMPAGREASWSFERSLMHWRSDEALEVRVNVARIAPSLLEFGRGIPTGSMLSKVLKFVANNLYLRKKRTFGA
ncbi:hypothetical protein PR048_007605 [Dryococelus australis]|uniref:Uncharacterized protein n=1 Tax=Dryococelus australis TaxID=614101 RepID=A0ABQ9HUQ3_9NEOP|nr:hypothetical protein PR048_007605 [Dryococelus australis]